MNYPDATFPGPDAVILLGRAGYGGAAQDELGALRARLAAELAHTQVHEAYVDRAGPGLPEALDACLQAAPRARHILLQPLFMPVDPALLRWLHKLVQRWRNRQARPEALPRIIFTPALGAQDGLATLLARRLRHASDLPDVTHTQPAHWEHDPAAWSEVPRLTGHLLLCTGPRCTALGAAGLWARLRSGLQADPALKKTVMLLHTGCQYPCNLGPLAISYPDGHWYGHLDEPAIQALLNARLRPEGTARGYVVHRITVAG